MTKKQKNKDKNEQYWTYPETHKAFEIGLYYGFTPASPVSIEKADHDHAKAFLDNPIDQHHIHPEEKIALLRTYFTKMPSQVPLMMMNENKLTSSEKKKDKIQLSLDIIGTGKSIADATVIKTCYEIIQSEGYDEISVEINSIGDKDSMNRCVRDLTTYFKKHLSELHADCRQLLKKSALATLTCDHPGCAEIKSRAPKPMNYLSESSRTHFKEVLELLEMSDIPYSINSCLIDNEGFASHTIFKIWGKGKEKQDPQLLAYGIRWANLGKKIGLKKDVPGISAVLYLSKSAKASNSTKKIKKPELYFIQMGREAKLKSLGFIETLRRAKIVVYHSLTKDKLTTQLSSAEYLNVSYILIMGQKESMENTVLIREMTNRSQETVRITEAADFLKKLVK